MNATFFNIVNGISAAAQVQQDPDSISAANKMLQLAAYAWGTKYDAAAAQATPVVGLGPNPYPAGSIAPTTDSIFSLGITDIRKAGG